MRVLIVPPSLSYVGQNSADLLTEVMLLSCHYHALVGYANYSK